MKKFILSLLIAASVFGVALPAANARVVVVVHRHRRHHHVIVAAAPRMILIPGHRQGPFWHRVWIPAHYVPA